MPASAKMSKKDVERKKKEEEERLAAEEEEARHRAEQEAREQKRLEKQRTQERKMLEKRELRLRAAELAEFCPIILQLNAANRHRLHDRLKKQRWARYMQCDGSPDPTSTRQMNTFLNLTQAEPRLRPVLEVMQQSALWLRLIRELELRLEQLRVMQRLHTEDRLNGMSADSTAAQQQQQQLENGNVTADAVATDDDDDDEVAPKGSAQSARLIRDQRKMIGKLYNLLVDRVNGASVYELSHAVDRADAETGNLQCSWRRGGGLFEVHMWANLSKNPRIKTHTFVLTGRGVTNANATAEEDAPVRGDPVSNIGSITFELPKPLTMADCAVRLVWTRFDALSVTANSFQSHRKVVDVQAALAETAENGGESGDTKQDEQQKEDGQDADDEESPAGADEQEETAPETGGLDLLAELGNLNDDANTEGEDEAGQNTAEFEEPDPEVPQEDLCPTPEPEDRNEQADEQEAEDEENEEEEVAAEFIDLRNYRPVGGVFQLDLFQLPTQPRPSGNGWTVMQQVPNERMQKFQYEAATVANAKDAGGAANTTSPNQNGAQPAEANQNPGDAMAAPDAATANTDAAGEDAEAAAAEAKRREEYRPVKLELHLNGGQWVLAEEPQLAMWNVQAREWRRAEECAGGGIQLDGWDEEKRLMRLSVPSSEALGCWALFQDYFVNMPFQSWTLRPIRAAHSAQSSLLSHWLEQTSFGPAGPIDNDNQNDDDQSSTDWERLKLGERIRLDRDGPLVDNPSTNQCLLTILAAVHEVTFHVCGTRIRIVPTGRYAPSSVAHEDVPTTTAAATTAAAASHEVDSLAGRWFRGVSELKVALRRAGLNVFPSSETGTNGRFPGKSKPAAAAAIYEAERGTTTTTAELDIHEHDGNAGKFVELADKRRTAEMRLYEQMAVLSGAGLVAFNWSKWNTHADTPASTCVVQAQLLATTQYLAAVPGPTESGNTDSKHVSVGGGSEQSAYQTACLNNPDSALDEERFRLIAFTRYKVNLLARTELDDDLTAPLSSQISPDLPATTTGGGGENTGGEDTGTAGDDEQQQRHKAESSMQGVPAQVCPELMTEHDLKAERDGQFHSNLLDTVKDWMSREHQKEQHQLQQQQREQQREQPNRSDSQRRRTSGMGTADRSSSIANLMMDANASAMATGAAVDRVVQQMDSEFYDTLRDLLRATRLLVCS